MAASESDTHERPRSRILEGRITDTGRRPQVSVGIGYRSSSVLLVGGEHLIDELRDKYQKPVSGADLLSVEFVHESMPSVIDAKA
jgi:hypothetical protein